MKEIPLTQSRVALVDDEDYERITAMGKWYFDKKYACMSIYRGRSNGKCMVKKITMHRFILNPPKGIQVDHINCDKLDNRRSNLRLCTISENAKNRGVSKTNKSGFKGVSWEAGKMKWRVSISIDNKSINIGSFLCKIEAARAYNEAALKYHGLFAKLNEIPQ